MLAFFDPFPFANPTDAIAEYEQRSSATRERALQSPSPGRFGHETIYRFVMREVTEITNNIGLHPVLRAQDCKIPDVEYSAFSPRPRTPNWLDQAQT
jgi:hypothetical protein